MKIRELLKVLKKNNFIVVDGEYFYNNNDKNNIDDLLDEEVVEIEPFLNEDTEEESFRNIIYVTSKLKQD